jgi:putative membrane protein
MLLSPQDHASIEAATHAAEASTRGEIVCVVSDEASHCPEVPVAWAAIAALILPVAPLMVGVAAGWLDSGLHGWSAAHIAASHAAVVAALGGYAMVQFLVFIGVLAFVSIPPIRRAMTPASIRHGHVHRRAMEQFYARGVNATAERTGVLIFASLKDRVAVVVADEGINAKVGPRAWTDVIDLLTSGLKAGRPGEGFTSAIHACGELLARHFPAIGNNPNELQDVLGEDPPT